MMKGSPQDLAFGFNSISPKWEVVAGYSTPFGDYSGSCISKDIYFLSGIFGDNLFSEMHEFIEYQSTYSYLFTFKGDY